MLNARTALIERFSAWSGSFSARFIYFSTWFFSPTTGFFGSFGSLENQIVRDNHAGTPETGIASLPAAQLPGFR